MQQRGHLKTFVLRDGSSALADTAFLVLFKEFIKTTLQLKSHH